MTSASDLTQTVVDYAQRVGFDLVAITPAGPSPDWQRFQHWLEAGYSGEMAWLAQRSLERADPRTLLPDARTLILLGCSYHQGDLPAALRNDPSRGLIAAYAWGDDYHDLLKPLLFELDAALRQASGRTSRGRAFVDSGPLLERSWAQQAGLGFIGKNTCLIHPALGSWFFLAALLVSDELEPGCWPLYPAGNSSGCGACSRCLTACPTAAFVAPHQLDARRCISYLTIELRGPIPRELRPQMGNWIFGCDVCQAVCPYNRRFAQPTRLPGLQAHADRLAPPLLELLALDETGFRRRFARSAVLRSKRRGLLRNVCVALGNWGDATAIPALEAALHDTEPLVRGHAAWALGQIGHPTTQHKLQTAAASESSTYVLAEISRALTDRQITP